MKKYFLTLLAVIAVLATIGVSCSPALNKTIAKGAIEVALAICIAENPGADEQSLREICRWTDELAPSVRELLSAQRKGAKKKFGAAICGDGGVSVLSTISKEGGLDVSVQDAAVGN